MPPSYATQHGGEGPNPYVAYSSAPSNSNFSSFDLKGSMESVRDLLGRWGKKAGEATRKADDPAGNTWQHLTTIFPHLHTSLPKTVQTLSKLPPKSINLNVFILESSRRSSSMVRFDINFWKSMASFTDLEIRKEALSLLTKLSTDRVALSILDIISCDHLIVLSKFDGIKSVGEESGSFEAMNNFANRKVQSYSGGLLRSYMIWMITS